MRDLPVAPISSTRAFLNRLDVTEERAERRGGGMKCVERTAPITERAQETLRRRRRGGVQRLGTFQGLSDRHEPEIQ